MKKSLLTLLITTSFASYLLTLNSCKTKNSTQESDTLKTVKQVSDTLVEVKSSEADSISIGAFLENAGPGLSSRGEQEKLWKGFFRGCIENAGWKLSNNAFLGISNSITLGQLYDRRSGLFSSVQPEKFVPPITMIGNNATCNIVTTTGKEFNLLIGSNIAKFANAELQTKIQSSKNSEITVGGFRVESLDELQFENLIKDPSFNQYTLAAKGRTKRIIAKILLVNGFNAEITTEGEINSALKAQLDAGITETLNISDAKIELSFKRTTSGKIIATSNREIVLATRLLKFKDF